jgi:signal peptidase
MMKKIIYIVVLIILFMAILLNVLSLSGISLLGFRIYKVGSGSMRPYLNVNDTIIIKKCDDYKLNDIVTYQNNEEYVTHRIVSINNSEIITKGDANNTQDDPITKDKIVGKLIYKFHIFGFLSFLLSKPFTWILLFIVGFLVTYFIPNKKEKE